MISSHGVNVYMFTLDHDLVSASLYILSVDKAVSPLPLIMSIVVLYDELHSSSDYGNLNLSHTDSCIEDLT